MGEREKEVPVGRSLGPRDSPPLAKTKSPPEATGVDLVLITLHHGLHVQEVDKGLYFGRRAKKDPSLADVNERVS